MEIYKHYSLGLQHRALCILGYFAVTPYDTGSSGTRSSSFNFYLLELFLAPTHTDTAPIKSWQQHYHLVSTNNRSGKVGQD